MAIIMISSKYQSGREELAQAVAKKTNWPMLTREEIIDGARELGIKVGRLELAMIKKPGRSERLAREKEQYLAYVTSCLCEKAKDGNLIYTGRAGHLMLPGVSNRLRVGLTTPLDIRIKRTAKALNISDEKAALHLKQLDEDIDQWTRAVHHMDSNDPDQYDVSFNLENIGINNAAGILCQMAELPDFQPTPVGRKIIDDLYLASQAKIRLAMDEKTRDSELQVQVDGGIITVTYPPHQSQVSSAIPAVLTDLPGCEGIQCTMAETNILWVQERFDPASETFAQINQVAQRWGAAVELLRLVPPGEPASNLSDENTHEGFGRQECRLPYTGGVEDDDPETNADDGGLIKAQEALIDLGRSGGQHTVCGGYAKVLEQAQGSGHYALVVIGDMFLSKGRSTRTRQTRELTMKIRDRLKAPVISAEELETKFLFGKRQAVTLVGFMAVIVAIYMFVFSHQKPILDMLGGAFHQNHKWLAAIMVALFVPFIAYLYGTVTGLALKLINID